MMPLIKNSNTNNIEVLRKERSMECKILCGFTPLKVIIIDSNINNMLLFMGLESLIGENRRIMPTMGCLWKCRTCSPTWCSKWKMKAILKSKLS